MKKLSIFFVAVIITSATFISCATSKNTGAKNQPKNETKTKTCLIPFKGTYETQSGTQIVYTKKDVSGINFQNSQNVAMDSKIFFDDYKVEDGRVRVFGPEATSIMTIPAGTIWRTKNDSTDIKYDPTTGTQAIRLTANPPGKDVEYVLWVKKSSDNSFYFNEVIKGWITYKGKTYRDATAKSPGAMYYCLVDETKSN